MLCRLRGDFGNAGDLGGASDLCECVDPLVNVRGGAGVDWNESTLFVRLGVVSGEAACTLIIFLSMASGEAARGIALPK